MINVGLEKLGLHLSLIIHPFSLKHPAPGGAPLSNLRGELFLSALSSKTKYYNIRFQFLATALTKKIVVRGLKMSSRGNEAAAAISAAKKIPLPNSKKQRHIKGVCDFFTGLTEVAGY